MNNPATYFATLGINGLDRKSFTYEPGDKPYYFTTPREGAFEYYVALSIIIFADDPTHARAILSDLLDFREACLREYYRSRGYPQTVANRIISETSEYKRLVAIWELSDKWEFVEAPRNQIYKVAWAANDTVL